MGGRGAVIFEWQRREKGGSRKQPGELNAIFVRVRGMHNKLLERGEREGLNVFILRNWADYWRAEFLNFFPLRIWDVCIA